MTKKYHRILLVDDDKVINFVNRKMIGMLNLADEVVAKESGELALNYIKETITSKEVLPDLIFLDIQMPIMNGFQFLDAFNDLTRQYELMNDSCKIIVLTSSFDPSDQDKMMSNPFVHKFMNKPLTKEMFDLV